jgi:glutathione peroxidase
LKATSTMIRWFSILSIFFGFAAHADLNNACSPIFNVTIDKLNSDTKLDLCEITANKVVMVVNTASYCGFTKHFLELQEIYNTYKSRGLVVIGFPSDDFYQEDQQESKTAKICYINFGVKFPMTEPVHVRGGNAISIFKNATRQSGQQPGWNFHKYLFNKKGDLIGSWSATTHPKNSEVITAIENALVNLEKSS